MILYQNGDCYIGELYEQNIACSDDNTTKVKYIPNGFGCFWEDNSSCQSLNLNKEKKRSKSSTPTHN